MPRLTALSLTKRSGRLSLRKLANACPALTSLKVRTPLVVDCPVEAMPPLRHVDLVGTSEELELSPPCPLDVSSRLGLAKNVHTLHLDFIPSLALVRGTPHVRHVVLPVRWRKLCCLSIDSKITSVKGCSSSLELLALPHDVMITNGVHLKQLARLQGLRVCDYDYESTGFDVNAHQSVLAQMSSLKELVVQCYRRVCPCWRQPSGWTPSFLVYHTDTPTCFSRLLPAFFSTGFGSSKAPSPSRTPCPVGKKKITFLFVNRTGNKCRALAVPRRMGVVGGWQCSKAPCPAPLL